MVIRSLGKPASGKGNQIKRVELLGHKGKLAFTQTPEGLRVTLPAQKPSEIACSLRITGSDLKPVAAPNPGGGK